MLGQIVPEGEACLQSKLRPARAPQRNCVYDPEPCVQKRSVRERRRKAENKSRQGSKFCLDILSSKLLLFWKENCASGEVSIIKDLFTFKF